ncbi:hypothetical protein EV646_11238 [Kribbella antiqua]|uniref:Uncharacterized protein n=1 Tax=Kribbella antiqua TaxID=2512217 RepID=A0A4R2IGT9_9ACTN|nr:hypothetical protein EV646_11238 [Kribbella antiqua]
MVGPVTQPPVTPQPDGLPEQTPNLPAHYEQPQPQPQYSPPPGPYQPPVGGPHQPPQSLPLQALPAGPVLVTVGDISVEQHRIVTPAGVMPTQGTNWSAMDMSRTEEKIPGWAIVMAIIFALACLLGLLFLLCKERKTTGFVQVTVQNGNRTHNTHVGVTSPRDVADTLARVNFARTLCV